jgi:ABC-type bacteriocin/lantibiotic exporter with double-glycine peptidase domain
MTFPFFPQLDAMDCGATCLRMIAKFYGKSYSNQFLREKSFITREGVFGCSCAFSTAKIWAVCKKNDFFINFLRIFIEKMQTKLYKNLWHFKIFSIKTTAKNSKKHQKAKIKVK